MQRKHASTPSQVPPAVPPPSQQDPLCFSIHLQSGHSLLADLYLCYDQGPGKPGPAVAAAQSAAPAAPAAAAPAATAAAAAEASAAAGGGAAASAGSESEWTTWCAGWAESSPTTAAGVCACPPPDLWSAHAAATCASAVAHRPPHTPPPSPTPPNLRRRLVTRGECCKGCQGPVLRSIQRFGRLGKRSAGDMPAAQLEGSRGGGGGGDAVKQKTMKVRRHPVAACHRRREAALGHRP